MNARRLRDLQQRSNRLRPRLRQTLRIGCFEKLEDRRVLTSEIEPNNSLATATVFPAGQTLEGRVSSVGDVDYFKVTLAQGAHLSIATDNVHDALFSPTLPPPIDLLDSAGNVLASSTDGRTVRFVAPRAGDYYARMVSSSAFGTFNADYAMQSVVTNYSGVTESEPNNIISQATVGTTGVGFRGDLSGDGKDLYRFDLTVGSTFVVDFTGLPGNLPGVRFLTSTGSVFDLDLTGQGLVVHIPDTATYYLELGLNAAGVNVGQYVGVANSYSRVQMTNDLGDTLDQNIDWNFPLQDTSQITGVIQSLGDVDVYKFNVTSNYQLTFNLQNSGGDLITGQSKLLTISNQFGQLLTYSTTGSISHDRTDANAPGTYFLTVSATTSMGLGHYALQVSSLGFFSDQRDVPLHFIDFNKQVPSYQGYDWANAYGATAGIPYIVGMFDARYDIYDVDVTQQLPSDNSERIASGYGDFGNIDGAAGRGRGWYGQRRNSGDTVNTTTETWNTLDYNYTAVLNHEFGHASGMPHARLPTALMGYVNTTQVLPVGDGTTFIGTDSRRPGTSVMNQRNYLDWSLQAGSQVTGQEPNDLVSNAQSVRGNLLEMTADLIPQIPVGTGQRPNQILAGDFNNDGRRDVVVASVDSNDVRVYLNNGIGGLTLRSTTVVDDLNWWEEPLAVGDFNGDGRSDVAVISRTNARVGILLSATDGSLGAPAWLSSGGFPTAITTGDVNRDGRLDLVVGNSNQVTTHLGNGNGTFGAPRSVIASIAVYSLVLADFTGDGFLDVATASDANGMNMLTNDGTGQFVGNTAYLSATKALGLTTGDFNRDGKQDIAVLDRDSHQILIYSNLGSGSFTPPIAIAGHRNAEMITTGDVNRDGIVDLISGGFNVTLVAMLGNGDGTFSRPVSLEGGDSEASAVVVDLTGDGFGDIVSANYFSNTITTFISQTDNPRNNRVTVLGNIDSRSDIDLVALPVRAGESWTIDVDAAEFQYPLDATLRVLSSSGAVLATNSEGLDRDSGLDSIDPYLTFTFSTTETVYIEVSGVRGSVGNYRLKMTPASAYEIDAPRVIASLPDNNATIDATNQITFFIDDQIDPATLTSSSLLVRGQSTGARSGTARFNPLDATITWTSSSPLGPDTYTVTLSGGANGVKDLRGNSLDGEIATNFRFPAVSGNGIAGGDLVMQFVVNATDTSPATINRVTYDRDPYQRGHFRVHFSDTLSVSSVESATFTLRGAGPDGSFGTADDRLLPLDVVYDKIYHNIGWFIDLYTRGIPDSDQYRIEANLIDSAGNAVNVAQPITIGTTVPETALFTDAALTQSGLVGSYINTSLRSQTAQADWRATQTIAGTRTDLTVAFNSDSWGTRSVLGLTGGSDANWDNFSAQWDGWIRIDVDGTRLQTRSDDGSRMWVDVNGDGSFAATNAEFFNNNFGLGQGVAAGALSAPLNRGNYRIRLQYEEGTGGNQMMLEWLTPDRPGASFGYAHGPAVIGLNVPAGITVTSPNLDRVEVNFSAALDLSSLTAQNFTLRYSRDAAFFDGNDTFIVDADGSIAWDPTIHRATMQTAQALRAGYYLIELNGDTGGLSAPDGHLLDGEFLNSRIFGNTTAAAWNESPSGDGIAGGDFRSMFVVGTSTLEIEIYPGNISEFGGSATGTVTRLNDLDMASPLVLTLASADTSEVSVPATVTIPAGQAWVTFPITAVDDTDIDGTQSAVITATASNFVSGSAAVNVTDYEPLKLAFDASRISENGGVLHGTITRTNNKGSLTASISNFNPGRSNMPTSVTFTDGQLSLPFTITAIDNNTLSGSVLVNLAVSATGMLDAFGSFTIDDYEPLAISIQPSAISERGGQALMTVSRPAGAGRIVVNLSTTSPDEIAIPSTVTIALGEVNSTPIAITGVVDNLLDGRQTAQIRATAIGYIDALGSIDVLDSEQLQLMLTANSISEKDGVLELRVSRIDVRGDLVVNLNVDLSGQVSIPATVTLRDGEFVSTPVLVRALDNQVLDGSRAITITGKAAGYLDGSTAFTLTDYEPLTISAVGATAMSERGGTAQFTVTRSDTSNAIDIALTSSDASEATVPPLLSLAAGVASQTFTVSAVDDSLLDGGQLVDVTASSPGYISGTVRLTVDDYEQLELTLSATNLPENAKTATGTVRRPNTDISQAITVQLSSSDSSEATVPTQVTIPAGQASATFTITSVDDSLLDGTVAVVLSAAATGYVAGTAAINVTDVEALTLSVDVPQISENAGTASVTVTRSNTDTGADLVVNLVTPAGSRLTVPATVTIPAGQPSVTFTVTAIDDQLLNPAFEVAIQATATLYTSATIQLTIADYEALSVSFDTNTVSERGGVLSGRVSRSNTNIDQSVNVVLSSSDTGEAIVPINVTIPAGQAFASFVLTGIDDRLLDGPQNVIITAMSSEYVSGQATMTVDDYETVIVSLNATSLAENHVSLTGTVTRSNSDQASAITVQLRSDQPGWLDVPAVVTIPAGQASSSFIITSIDDNLLTGDRNLLLTADASGYVSSTFALSILDIEALSISFDAASISERNGVTIGKVRRSNSNIEAALSVVLSSGRPGEANVPASVTIAAGQSEATFAVTAVDDNLLDGSQLTTILASASGYQDGTAQLSVTDYETLTVSIPAVPLSEKNGAATAVVRRNNEDLGAPLTVSLTSSDSSQLSVPASVTIPVNATLTTFTITSIDDSLLDGQRSFVITATASGYIEGTASVQVTDDESAFPWNNPRNSLDVNNNGSVTAIDALLIINELNSGRGGKLNPPPPGNNFFYDTSADNFLTAIDALLVINYLNTHPGGEGESWSVNRKRRLYDVALEELFSQDSNSTLSPPLSRRALAPVFEA